MSAKPHVLIICTGNSMRSQMGEALLRLDLGRWIVVSSAGTHPGFVHPLTIASLQSIGIDTTALRSKSVKEFLDKPIDLAITVCDSANERCPVFPHAARRIHKAYQDPLGRVNGSNAQQLMDDLRDRMRLELRELVIKELNLPRA